MRALEEQEFVIEELKRRVATLEAQLAEEKARRQNKDDVGQSVPRTEPSVNTGFVFQWWQRVGGDVMNPVNDYPREIGNLYRKCNTGTQSGEHRSPVDKKLTFRHFCNCLRLVQVFQWWERVGGDVMVKIGTAEVQGGPELQVTREIDSIKVFGAASGGVKALPQIWERRSGELVDLEGDQDSAFQDPRKSSRDVVKETSLEQELEVADVAE
ncbi:hypothetical protein LR48_Vigan08g202000 [Vigna angularis]|uniref:Uncharacterized protein n=1 Tax=Phaseolus angularis TaxID=3914 RepID=A0A0L9V871_PHAAN|nr:hypothetical protein LR48_Vigan08g202000 [Vigna angularis]